MKDLTATARAAAEKVTPLFEHHAWTWAGAENGVPTVDEVEETILYLMEACLRSPDAEAIGTGRLRVLRHSWEDVDGFEREEFDVCLELGSVAR